MQEKLNISFVLFNKKSWKVYRLLGHLRFIFANVNQKIIWQSIRLLLPL